VTNFDRDQRAAVNDSLAACGVQNLAGKLLRKRTVERPISRGKGNNKLELIEKAFEDGRWMELTSHSERWVVFVLAVLD
jgi:hypothetical protein